MTSFSDEASTKGDEANEKRMAGTPQARKRKPAIADGASAEAETSTQDMPAAVITSAVKSEAKQKATTAVIGQAGKLAASGPRVDKTVEAGATKAEGVLKLLRRKKGASIEEMQQATGWQSHSVRGFLSATVKKRMGLPLASELGSNGIRRYVVAAD